MDPFTEKKRLREQMRLLRNSIEAQETKSAQIIARLQQMPVYQSAQLIMSYLNIRSEVQTTRLVDQLLTKGSPSVLIPYITGDHLQLFRLNTWSQLQRKQFGILEPSEKALTEQKKETIWPELILVPGLAFDRQGGRLGYGAGYYDRLLNQRSQEKKPALIGLCYQAQLVEQVPQEKHDHLLDYLITETETIHCQQQ